MHIALTGTPGTGKTTVAQLLKQLKIMVIDLNHLATEQGFLEGRDEQRDTYLLNTEKLNRYVEETYEQTDEPLLFEGHVAHLLPTLETVIILRCHPDELRKRLAHKQWTQEKIKENIEAEALDIILSESVEIHEEADIFEINTTDLSPKLVSKAIIEIITHKCKPITKYNIGQLDWSEEFIP